MEKCNIIVVDDHPIFRDGLKIFIENIPFVKKVYETDSVKSLLHILNKIKPDVIFMDINMPEIDGIEGCKEVLKILPSVKVIGISSYAEIEYIDNMLVSGALGYLLKDATKDEIETALKKVLKNEYYFSARVLAILSERAVYQKENKKTPEIDLTEREKEVLFHICKGDTRKEIAEKLFISERTVDKHRENIQIKTNTNNLVKLVLFSIKNGLINFNDLNI